MRRALAALATCWLLAACTASQAPEAIRNRYDDWLHQGTHAEAVTAYRKVLIAAHVGEVVPMPALLRTSRRWQLCLHDEFDVPPKALWPAIAPTLRLVAELRDAGLVDPALARSGYRRPDINRCAGGAGGSRHLDNVAVDFDLPDRPDNIARLCAYWRTHGPAKRMGLGFYSSTAIHIDTAGFRTWGDDHHRATSLCVRGA